MKHHLPPIVAGAAVALLAAVPASSHHSTAMYDHANGVSLTGVVQGVEWVNPHVTVDLLVAGKNGAAPALWTLEASSPGVLTRSGLSKRSFKPGDKVTLEVAPLRRGGNAGAFRKATLASGETVTISFK